MDPEPARPCFVITGTDTGVGKTVFAAALARALDAYYWKPVQAGTGEETDTAAVQRLTGLPSERLLAEAYRLRQPEAPHFAALREGVAIEVGKLTLPATGGQALVVEGVGGLLVPLAKQVLLADVIAGWDQPVIVCARTRLGTINHTLLTLEVARARGLRVHGVAFIGFAEPEVEQLIVELGQVRRLGRLPMLAPLNRQTLVDAFAVGFELDDFASAAGGAR